MFMALLKSPGKFYSITSCLHPRAFLLFESSSCTDNEVGADKIASTLAERGVKAAILNACRSAQKPRLAESSIASTLLSHVHELQFVIAMSYNVRHEAVKYFLQELYNALLLENQTISEAVFMGRKKVQQKPIRKGRFGIEVNVQDWFNPILYLRNPATKRLRMASGQESLAVQAPPHEPDWCSGLYGRDYDIACIEKALSGGATIVRVHGFRGAGKSTLMKHLQEWWVRSNFVEAVFVVDFSETKEDSPTIYPGDIFTQIDTILTERNRNLAERRRVYSIGPTSLAGPRRDSHMDKGVTGHTDLQLGIIYCSESERHYIPLERCILSGEVSHPLQLLRQSLVSCLRWSIQLPLLDRGDETLARCSRLVELEQ
jgi:hypothetical protein